jgi:GTPase SAR1 family protein
VISGKKVLFEIWDISVNENFRLMLPSLYSSVMGVLLVFSVDNRNSFNSVAVWMKQI